MKKLLTREDFKTLVFKRDSQKCILCPLPAVDAHHLLERKLFPDGGYYLNNGVSLCESHHMDAETTSLSIEFLRQKAKITEKVLPPNFSDSKTYDKWGNEIKDNDLIPGPLYEDRGCQKMLSLKKKT